MRARYLRKKMNNKINTMLLVSKPTTQGTPVIELYEYRDHEICTHKELLSPAQLRDLYVVQ